LEEEMVDSFPGILLEVMSMTFLLIKISDETLKNFPLSFGGYFEHPVELGNRFFW
jgi:hypothetical protein